MWSKDQKEYFARVIKFEQQRLYTVPECIELFNILLNKFLQEHKLYKYRSFSGKSFEYAFDALQKGYIWCSRFDQLNDREEGNMLFSMSGEIDRAYKELFEGANYLKTLKAMCNKFYGVIDSSCLSDQDFYDLFNSYTHDGRLNRSKLHKILVCKGGVRDHDARFIMDDIERSPNKFVHNEKILKEALHRLLDIKSNVRKDIFMYSFAESYDINSMWAYYANNNRGFCIEYDYSKLAYTDVWKMRYLLNTFPVSYEGNRQLELSKYLINYIRSNYCDSNKLNLEMLKIYCTKDDSWSNEREWRLWFADSTQKGYGVPIEIDVVSGIYIDASMMNHAKARKLISLAKERAWNVYIRVFDDANLDYQYIELLEYKRRGELTDDGSF